jgi:hypothetical protein
MRRTSTATVAATGTPDVTKLAAAADDAAGIACAGKAQGSQ